MKLGNTLLVVAIYSLCCFLTEAVADEYGPVTCKPLADGAGDAGPAATSTSPSSASSRETPCTSWWFVANKKLNRLWNRYRRRLLRMSANPEVAYRMMIMATMSYWEFHKRTLPSNTTGFTLLPPRTTQARVTGRKRKFIKKQIRKAKRSLVTVLAKGTIFSPIHLESFQRKAKRASASTREASVHQDDKYRLTFAYWMFDWYESGLAKARFHDTDVLIAYSPYDDSLVISFGGTSSAADAVTNIQTFEPANHSGFYHGGRGGDEGCAGNRNLNFGAKSSDSVGTTIEGSLHRGFLNAYARVDRGSVLRICQDKKCEDHEDGPAFILDTLHQSFGNCTLNYPKKEKRMAADFENQSFVAQTNATRDSPSQASTGSFSVRQRRKGDGCFSTGKKLSAILQDLLSASLRQGMAVHLTGHSLGGGLASHLALDMVINFPHIPIDKLHLWTFGAPQICDALFLTSAVTVAPRLGPFVEIDGSDGLNGRLHRYVTLSDKCQVDAVSEVAKRSLPAHRPKGIGRLLARTLGGVHDHIVHFVEPHYLLTPQQELRMAKLSSPAKIDRRRARMSGMEGNAVRTPNFKRKRQDPTPTDETRFEPTLTASAVNTTETEKESIELSATTNIETIASTTHSAVAAHACVNYLMGISRESRGHPLQTDLPLMVKEWLGEDLLLSASSLSAGDDGKNRTTA